MNQTVENQALREILSAYSACPTEYILLFKPTLYRLTSQSVGTIFAGKNARFFYTLSIYLNKLNKNSQTLENQGFGFLG